LVDERMKKRERREGEKNTQWIERVDADGGRRLVRGLERREKGDGIQKEITVGDSFWL